MAETKINITEVMNASSRGNSAKNTVSSAASGIRSTRNGIDAKILNRNNISGRLNNVAGQVSQIARDIGSITVSIGNGACQYQNAENTVLCYARDVSNNNAVQNKGNTTNQQGVYSAYFYENWSDDLLQHAGAGGETGRGAWNWFYDLLDKGGNINDFLTDVLPGEEVVLAGKMWHEGIKFATKNVDGKIYLQMDNIKDLTHSEISDILKKYVTDANLDDYDIRRLINDGLPLYKESGNLTTEGRKLTENILTNTDDLLDMSGAFKGCKSITDSLKNAGNVFNKTFADEITGILDVSNLQGLGEVFDFSNFSALSKADKADDILAKAGKAGKALGVVGDVLTVGTEIFDNNYNYETNTWEFTANSVTSTVTDVAVDFATSAGSMATGAAIGSFIVPPVGTVVGAAAGLAIDGLINWEFDLNGDGEKNSAVGLLKDGVDFVADAVIDKIGSWFS